MKGLNQAATRRAVKALLADRERLDDRVGSRCDILGSMIGIKVRGDALVPRIVMTYFVREKLPLDAIDPRLRIPGTLTIDGRRVHTDVAVWRPTATHALSDTRILRDGRTQGTLTAFAQTDSSVFGLTCGHCLLGPDRNPATQTGIDMDATPAQTWATVGTSAATLFLPGGPLLLGGRGYLDCGLFTLADATLRARAEASVPVDVADWASLPGQRVFGASTLKRAANAKDDNDANASQQRSATVLGVHGHALGEHCDVVLRADAPGMIVGDSGMLWFTAQRKAAVIHCRGEIRNDNAGSREITGMSAQRAAAALGIRLRMG